MLHACSHAHTTCVILAELKRQLLMLRAGTGDTLQHARNCQSGYCDIQTCACLWLQGPKAGPGCRFTNDPGFNACQVRQGCPLLSSARPLCSSGLHHRGCPNCCAVLNHSAHQDCSREAELHAIQRPDTAIETVICSLLPTCACTVCAARSASQHHQCHCSHLPDGNLPHGSCC
jgi:hypothetical protein